MPAMTRALRWPLIVLGVLLATAARGEDPPTVSIPRTSGHLLPTASDRAGRGSSGLRGNAGGWWMAPAGLVAALAIFGGAVMAARRFSPAMGLESSTRALRVIGRAPLTPRHAVHMVRAGGRTLLIGTGPQGAPSLIADWETTEPAPNRAGASS